MVLSLNVYTPLAVPRA